MVRLTDHLDMTIAVYRGRQRQATKHKQNNKQHLAPSYFSDTDHKFTVFIRLLDGGFVPLE